MDTAEARTMTGGEARRPVYDAFLSYSHEADEQLAARLQAGLQRFAKPWREVRVMRLKQVILVVVALMLLATGCGGEDTATPTPASTASTPTTTQPTTAVPTTTTAPATTTSEPWDMVFISDSFGLGVAQAWAERIEEAEGVEVRVHAHVVGQLSLAQVREWFTEKDEFRIREEVADAEIIFVFGNPDGIAHVDMGTCGSTSKAPRDPPEHNTPADWAPYGDVLRDILDEIFELRAGQPTVIRVADYFASAIADWREAGIEAECTAGWEAWAGVIREAADEYGVGMASWYDAFNGPDHDEDPREKGYIADDGWHQSHDAGVAAQVEVLHALGYDPIVP